MSKWFKAILPITQSSFSKLIISYEKSVLHLLHQSVLNLSRDWNWIHFFQGYHDAILTHLCENLGASKTEKKTKKLSPKVVSMSIFFIFSVRMRQILFESLAYISFFLFLLCIIWLIISFVTVSNCNFAVSGKSQSNDSLFLSVSFDYSLRQWYNCYFG